MRALFSLSILATVVPLFVACGKDNVDPPTHGGRGGTPSSLGGAAGSAALDGQVIDDLEDGDLFIAPLQGRNGSWRTVGDDTVTMALTIESGDDARGTHSVHVTSPSHSTWGGGTALSFLAEPGNSGYDASGYTGIRFWAKSATNKSLRVSIPDKQTEQAGGMCTACWDHFSTVISLTPEWKEYVIAFNRLGQQGWGDGWLALSTPNLFGLQFHIGTEEAIDFWLDDLRFALPGEEKPIIEEPPPRVVPDETPFEMHGSLHVDGTKIKDEQGDVVQLKGVSSMWLNWENDGFAESLEALEWVRDQWGVSVIRAAMGVEPEGAYSTDPDKAKAQVDTIVQNAVSAGIYVIIDYHAHEANENQEQALAFFAEVAEKYKDLPNVIYETFNEPLKVDWATELKPYHEAVVAEIRDHAPDALIILGTPEWDQKIDAAAADPLTGTNLLYAVHFYACSHGGWLRNRAAAALATGLPLFLSEWGATAADGGLNGVVCESEAEAWTDWAKENAIGWAAWKLDACPDASCILSTAAPVDGPWTTDALQGHGYFVRAKIMEE